MWTQFLQRSNMVASTLTVCVCVLLLAGIRGLQLEDREERICAFASSLKGAEPASTNELRGDVQENGTIRCSRGSRCYGLWERQADGEMQLLSQGQECLSFSLGCLNPRKIQMLRPALWSKLCSGWPRRSKCFS
ncbi:hypothetical protein ILYODFUR_028139 [Ilyodon furcidens]|uniref:Uncharacterized protein n=1 Tax=Ilyodon furcidens TaxID=33524 RepID=A0ABV0UYN6_9TELE